MKPIRDLETLNAIREAGVAKLLPSRPRIAIGMGTCGAGNGAEGVYHAFAEAIGKRGLDIQLVSTGCFGFCAEEPLVNVWRPGRPLLVLHRVQQDHVDKILDGLGRNSIPELDDPLQDRANGTTSPAQIEYGIGFRAIPAWDDDPLLRRAEEDRPAQLRPHQP